MRRIVTGLLILAACVACSFSEMVPVDEVPGRGLVMADFSALIQGGYETEGVRSVLPEKTIEDKITQVTLASYDERGRLTDACHYSGGFSAMKLHIQSEGQNTIYALVNMGDMTARMPAKETGLTDLTYSLESFEDVEAAGIPMSGMLAGVTVDNRLRNIPVERLFAKVCIRILHTSLGNASVSNPYAYNLKNVSLFIRQANGCLSPFSNRGSRALMTSDLLDVSDFCQDMNSRDDYEGSLPSSALGPGPGYFQDTTFVFYVPENVQGDLLRGNTDPLAKVESGIKDVNGRDYSGLCTYVEFNAKRENTGQGYYGSVKYRFYLGEDDVADFSVAGNSRYDLTLDLTENGFHIESWKVTRGDDWTDTRVLSFMNAPYVVYRGGRCAVNVRYHRSRPDNGSEARPDDWVYVFDDSRMRAAGLSYVFDKDVSGGKDFCFSFTAAADAEVGAVFPLKVMTKDGSMVDEATISIADAGALVPVWDHPPFYVSQYGTIKVEGAAADKLPLQAVASEDGIFRLERINDVEFKVVSLSVGTADINISNADGSQSLTVPLSVKPPVLEVPDMKLLLNPDGAFSSIAYRYLDDFGAELQNVDHDVYMSALLPELAEETFFSLDPYEDRASLYINKLTDGDAKLSLRGEYSLHLQAGGCPEVVPREVTVAVTDPFAGIGKHDYGRLDDYSLFAMKGVPERLKACFKNEISADQELLFSAPVPDCDQTLVSAFLKPSWGDRFTYSNEVYGLSYVGPSASSGATLRLTRNALTSSTRHGAGRHDVMLSVMNRHSHETVDSSCGEIDVYVHAALGARADFSSQRCDYRQGAYAKTFAEVYNSIAGVDVYNPSSSDMVHFMDVKLEWMVDVSGARVFNDLSTSASSEALGLVTPGRADGERDQRVRMLYSVCRSADDRLGVGGETTGPRAGIGRTLYRALLLQTYDFALSDSDLQRWFLGYNPESGYSSQDYSPSYLLHDMRSDTDSERNVLNSRKPFHYSPPSFGTYVDSEGKGYYVIHFLEEIAPETGGWINLL